MKYFVSRIELQLTYSIVLIRGLRFHSGETEEHLKEFAREGLRTLCFAYTTIDEESYNVSVLHS